MGLTSEVRSNSKVSHWSTAKGRLEDTARLVEKIAGPALQK